MSETVTTYFAKLETLSDEELDRSAGELALHEKHDIARFIAHLALMTKRKYHVDLRYRNLFEYCVKRFNLSEGSVYRRIQVATVCREFPAILVAISQGRLHLTGASLLAPHLAEDNVERLIAAAQGKTKREVEELLVTLAPRKPFEPSVRKASDPAPAPGASVLPSPQERGDLAAPEKAAIEATPAGAGSADGKRTRDLLQPATEDRYNVRFSAGRAFTEKLTRLAEVLGIEHPKNHLEEILTKALDIALEKQDPERKLERRRKREARKEPSSSGTTEKERTPCPGKVESPKAAKQKDSSPSRHVPAEVRERVLERAGYQCEYRGPDGTRCTSRTRLHVEHEEPFAVYHSHDEEHLRAFCQAHNLRSAEKYYGEEFMKQKIDAARRKRGGPSAADAVP